MSLRFASRVQAALNESHAQKAYWGIQVVDRDSGETLYELNADRFFTPASNAKIFTTSLAFATLGSELSFPHHAGNRRNNFSGRALAGDVSAGRRGAIPIYRIADSRSPEKSNAMGPVEKILAEMADKLRLKVCKKSTATWSRTTAITLRSVSGGMEHGRYFFHLRLAGRRHRVQRQRHFGHGAYPAPSVGDGQL